MLLRSTEKYKVFCSFLDFDKKNSTNFAENMNSALPSDRTLPHCEEVLVNALSLQNYGDQLTRFKASSLHNYRDNALAKPNFSSFRRTI